MIQPNLKADHMSFTKSPHLEHIDFEDGMTSYCRPCDSEQPFVAVKARPGYVACGGCGKKVHSGNLVINGARKGR